MCVDVCVCVAVASGPGRALAYDIDLFSERGFTRALDECHISKEILRELIAHFGNWAAVRLPPASCFHALSLIVSLCGSLSVFFFLCLCLCLSLSLSLSLSLFLSPLSPLSLSLHLFSFFLSVLVSLLLLLLLFVLIEDIVYALSCEGVIVCARKLTLRCMRGI